jgi:hypothetical protein
MGRGVSRLNSKDFVIKIDFRIRLIGIRLLEIDIL